MGFTGTKVHINWSGRARKNPITPIINSPEEKSGELVSGRKQRGFEIMHSHKVQQKEKEKSWSSFTFILRYWRKRRVLSALPTSIEEHKSLRDRNNNRKIDFNWKIKTDFHSNACRFHRNLTPSSFYYCDRRKIFTKKKKGLFFIPPVFGKNNKEIWREAHFH